MNREPKKTTAIVVGVENYDAGQSWNLKGPAHDACKFATWLSDKQVPPENISLFISPLAENRELELPNGLSFQAATEQNVTSLVEKALAQSSHDLLYFYWGGHGVITTAGERQLFYADATVANKKNLDLNALLAFLRTDYFHAGALARQIVLVDACANYVENMGATKDLPQRSFPNGKPLENREQFVLMAAKPGEFAKNLDDEKTGLFTKELMLQLDKSANHLPDMQAITQNLQARFEILRTEKKAEQTATFMWIHDWNSNEELALIGDKSEEIFDYDAYISYVDKEPDLTWVWETLIKSLENEGLKLTVSGEGKPGVEQIVSIEQGIKLAKRIIVVLSDNYLANNMAHFENVLGQTMGIKEGSYRLLPIKFAAMDESKIPVRLSMLTTLNLSHPRRAEREFDRLVQTLQGHLPKK